MLPCFSNGLQRKFQPGSVIGYNAMILYQVRLGYRDLELTAAKWQQYRRMSRKEWSLIGISLLCGIGTFVFIEPIPQWLDYHQFADGRTMLGIPNALNVLSNIPFLIFGIWGAGFLIAAMARQGYEARLFLYLVFFAGFALVAIGSGYYHLWPSNETLVWDRLPMTIAFMALLSAVIAEQINPVPAIRLLPLFLLIGAFSVFYWDYTEQIGRGDLRLYGLVQFLPMLLIALMLWLYERPDQFLKYIIGAAVLYGIAKIFEALDLAIFQSLIIVSGHSLKHLFASGAGLALLLMLFRRQESLFDRGGSG